MTDFRSTLRRVSVAAAGLALCSAAVAADPPRFTVSEDGQEVLDTKSGLIWRRCVEGMKWDGKTCAGKAVKYKLADARGLATKAAAAGKAWRIPDRADIEHLLIKTKGEKKPLIDKSMFPGTPSAPFWALRDGYTDNLNAWLVDFANAHVYGSSGSKHFLRLVRPKS